MTFHIQVVPSGHAFNAQEGETVLDAALRAGITLPYGCRNGECGNCEGRILDGLVSYQDERPTRLTDAAVESGSALFCKAAPVSDLRIEVREIHNAAELPVKRMPCRVVHSERIAHDVIRLYLKLPDNLRLQFLAGQYIDFILSDGRRRAFSIANAPHEDEHIELHIRHIDGGEFTKYVFEQIRNKEILRIEGPLGTFYLREDSDRPVIFVAGGTGFAPVKGMLEHAFSEGVQRTLHLYWGVRARSDLYLDELPRGWAGEHSNFRYTPVLSAPQSDDGWEGRCGLIYEAVLQDHDDLSEFDVYACGPPAMVHAGRDAFLARGLPPQQYYSDAFGFTHDQAHTNS